MCEYSDYTAARSTAQPFDFEAIAKLVNDFRMRMELEQSIDQWCFNVTAEPCKECGHKMRIGDGAGETVYVCDHVMAELRRCIPTVPVSDQHRISFPSTLAGLRIEVESPEHEP